MEETKIMPNSNKKKKELSSFFWKSKVIERLKTNMNNIQKFVPELLEKYTGHEKENFLSINNFVSLMHEKTDGASLGVGRMLFGKNQFFFKEKLYKRNWRKIEINKFLT